MKYVMRCTNPNCGLYEEVDTPSSCWRCGCARVIHKTKVEEPVKTIRYILMDDHRNEPRFLCANGSWMDTSDLIQEISKPHEETYELKKMCGDWVEDLEAEGDKTIREDFTILQGKTHILPSAKCWEIAFNHIFEKGDWV